MKLESKSLQEAVLQGSMERLRPVIMTALAAGLALVPFAFASDNPGNEILSPLAIVILGGLLSSTILNMVVLPSLYLKFGRQEEIVWATLDLRTPAELYAGCAGSKQVPYNASVENVSAVFDGFRWQCKKFRSDQIAFAADKPGNEILSPLAIVILGGLLSSTALNMIVIPALYVKFEREEKER